MAFGKMGIRAWSREWRQSDWRETIPLASGRECPEDGCKVTVCGGSSWRDHSRGHEAANERLETLEEALRTCIESVRMIAVELEKRGIITIVGGRGEVEEPENVPELRGRVIGNGPLPEEMRGEEE